MFNVVHLGFRKSISAIVIPMSVLIAGCSSDPAPPIPNTAKSDTAQDGVFTKSKPDSGASTDDYDLYGVNFPDSGSLTTTLSSDETLTFSVSIFTEETDIPDFYCHHREDASAIFNRVLGSYTCEELLSLESNPSLMQKIEQSLTEALEAEFQEATLDTTKEILEIKFEVDACI